MEKTQCLNIYKDLLRMMPIIINNDKYSDTFYNLMKQTENCDSFYNLQSYRNEMNQEKIKNFVYNKYQDIRIDLLKAYLVDVGNFNFRKFNEK